jgi:two-component system, LytTR family, sensor histidine kinase AlgZ
MKHPVSDTSGGAEALLPSFCSVQTLLFLILTTELTVLAISLAADLPGPDFWMGFGLKSLYAQWLALGSAAVLCAGGNILKGNLGPSGQAAAALVTVGVMSFLLSSAAYPIINPAEAPLQFILRNLALSVIMAGLALRYLYLQFLHRQQISAESRARFQSLQARIRPHFLFNSMNTIASLTRSKPELAETVVEDLADLFRASISDATGLVTLEEELDLARRYINIESLRLGERLQIAWQVEGLPETVLLPKLTLQPLLENAIYHGIEKRRDGGRISVIGSMEGDNVTLRIENPLPELGSSPSRKGFGMALDNVRQRLKTVFGDAAALTESREPEHYSVKISFPMDIDEYSYRG